MKIIKNNGIKIAEQVAKELRKFVPYSTHEFFKDITVTTYKNGRESGYTFNASFAWGGKYVQRSVSVAENRKSDDIVVYTFDTWDGGDNLTDEAYDNKKFFAPNQIIEVAEFVWSFLFNVKNIK